MSNEEDYHGTGEGKTLVPNFGREAGLNYRPKTVVEILESCFKINFQMGINRFINMDYKRLVSETSVPDSWDRVEWSKFDFYWIKSVLEQPMSAIWMDLIFRGTIRNCENGDSRRVYIAARVCLNLSPCHQTCTVPVFRYYVWNEKDPLFDGPGAIKLNPYLLPYIKGNTYAGLALKILKYFYSGKLDTSDDIVSGEKFAADLGLKIVSFPFPVEDTDMGRMMFIPDIITVKKDDGNETDYYIDSASILLNSRYCKTEKDRNVTILHECIHFILDRFFFFLQYVAFKNSKNSMTAFGRSQAVIENQRNEHAEGKRDRSGWTPIDWMEYQAEKLPIYLILNEPQTRRCIEQCIQENGGIRSADVMRRCMKQVSEKFDVSMSMAKIRMIELGYTEAQGIYNFDKNSNELRDYSCHEWKESIGYCIDLDDLTDLLMSDERLSKAVGSGRYIYVDNHLCLNHPAYVDNRGSSCHMTEYGNAHLDECCISFYVVRQCLKKPNASSYRKGRNDRLLAYASCSKKTPVTDKYRPAPVFREEAKAADLFQDNCNAYDDALRWGELETELPNNFGDAVKLIMRRKKITQEELSFRLEISRAMVQYVLKNDRLSLSHVVGVCVALEIPYYISEDLVSLAGFSLKPVGIVSLYKNFLAHPSIYNVERCNELLKQKKLPTFFECRDK